MGLGLPLQKEMPRETMEALFAYTGAVLILQPPLYTVYIKSIHTAHPQ